MRWEENATPRSAPKFIVSKIAHEVGKARTPVGRDG